MTIKEEIEDLKATRQNLILLILGAAAIGNEGPQTAWQIAYHMDLVNGREVSSALKTLTERGLVDSKARMSEGNVRLYYWLTMEGAEKAEELKESSQCTGR